MTCDDCGAPAKPLLFGKYCTADCDKPKEDDGTEIRRRLGPNVFKIDPDWDINLDWDQDEPTKPGHGDTKLYKCLLCQQLSNRDPNLVANGQTCDESVGGFMVCGGMLRMFP